MTNKIEQKKYIDIAKIIKESDSKLLKNLPGFVIKLISKIIMQDEMNYILNKYNDQIGRDFLIAILKEFNLTLQIEGKEHLPENGKCFFASNHPFGIIDGLILTYIVSGKYGTLNAIANDAFKFIPQLRPFIAAVNVYGMSSKEYIKALDEIYKSDTPITHFPAGEVSRPYKKWKIQDTDWQKSFITKSRDNNRDIVPFYFSGTNSRLFNTIFKIRQFLGIKINIELMLLPREMFKKRGNTIKVKIGKPISYKTFDNSISPREWAQKVKEIVYNLAK